jgi:hypothetical protein
MTILLQTRSCASPGEKRGLIHNKIVISTGVPIDLWPTPGDEKGFGLATTLYATVVLSFVIPSEAEGSAVPRTFVETSTFILKQNCHLDRSAA